MTARSLLVCATEISGDARGARLAGELLRLAPGLRIHGLGGKRMREAGVDVRLDITDRGTVGWFDHWGDLPCYLAALRFWRREIRDRRPDGVMVIDAPGISFPFARIARAAGVPVIYFVTPQTWLWNPDRACERLRTHADVVVPTLEAEAAVYERARLPVIYEGHPALDDLVATYGDRACTPPRAKGGRPAITIGLVPGSRRHAVRRLLPIMLDTVDLLDADGARPRVLIGVAATSLQDEVERQMTHRRRPVEVVAEGLAQVLRASDVVLASTGGNLLEAVYADAPAVACYRVDAMTHAIARYGMRLEGRLSAFALPNLVAGERIVPELIQAEVTAENLAAHALRLCRDDGARQAMTDGYRRVRDRLGRPGVNARIAERIIPLVDPGCPAPRPRRP
jgi:lipid-A-disaccharide synthase